MLTSMKTILMQKIVYRQVRIYMNRQVKARTRTLRQAQNVQLQNRKNM